MGVYFWKNQRGAAFYCYDLQISESVDEAANYGHVDSGFRCVRRFNVRL